MERGEFEKAGNGWARMIENEINLLRKKVDTLEEWKNWIVGAGAVIGFILGMFAKQLVHALGMTA